MHPFTELVDRCAQFSIATIRKDNERTVDALQTSGATSLVKNLQMLQMQKIIVCVGMFSLFESILQTALDCGDGFVEATKILIAGGHTTLQEEFYEFQCAINVLKHGRGRSYDQLLAKASTLPFRVVLPDGEDPDEGDVSQVYSLIKVDDDFIRTCSLMIQRVAVAIQQAVPVTYL